MLTLLAPQLVIDESGYGQNGPTETFVFAGFIEEVHQWEDFADCWEPIMNEKRPCTTKTLKRNRGKNDHPRILQLVKVNCRQRDRARSAQDST
jgi:hypothetical protein